MLSLEIRALLWQFYITQQNLVLALLRLSKHRTLNMCIIQMENSR